MQIEQRSVGDVVILNLVGRFVRGVGDRTFHGAIDELLEGAPTKVLLDLSEVPFIDSSGIGELVAAKRRADEQGTSLKLIRIEERVAKTLRLSMILPLFESFSSEEEALASFAGSADS
ncbi:MAG: STAS domain-containing protein [Thermoanaerobaculia bacterium]|nr:STAS domain-containing protein [Thermoanaerobaculia bacterium]